MEDNLKISLAPLQGYTDWVFRKSYQKYFRGMDEFYTPFLVLQNKGELKGSHKREVEPFEERAEKLIPQFLGGTVQELKFFEDYFSELGYSLMNWNVGCPYPMVSKRGKGSGLLPYPDRINEILESADKQKISLSVKMRLGLESAEEVFPVLDVLKQHDIDELILHPRIGKQLYKGSADREMFGKCLEYYGKNIAYNGDINTLEDFSKCRDEFPALEHVMIGRGVLNDLFLPEKIKGIAFSKGEKSDTLKSFYEDIFSTYSEILSGNAQILQKMKPFWEYFSNHFNNERKVYKMIKKSASIDKYETAVNFAFQQGVKGE